MQKKFLLPVLLVCASLLFSCETKITDIVIPFTKQLVVEAYLCPQDTLIKFNISSNSPTVGLVSDSNIVHPVPNALVILSDGQKQVQLRFKGVFIQMLLGGSQRLAAGYFVLDTREFPIIVGKTYTLKVTAPGYPPVTATCTVPENKVDKKTIQIIKGNQTTTQGTQLHPKLIWKDVSGEENYYNISVYYTFDNEYRGPDSKGVWQVRTIESGMYPAIFERDTYLSDYGLDGQTFTKEGSVYYYDQAIPADTSYGYTVVKNQKIVANVAAISKEFYTYQVKLIKQRDSQGNPFAEPVQVTGNIEGGLGFFGAYNRTEVVLDLKK